nr:hypothetical protein B0A51_17587 [Rachicladosporium sp. CCFEE 5018]
MTDVGALQSLPDQTFPSTSGMESSAFGQASLQPGEVQDFQMPLEALTLARAGLSYSSSALQSDTYRLRSAAAIRRSGAVQLEDDYDDIAAVKQSAKQWVKRMMWVYDEAVPYQVPTDMTPDLYHAVQRYCYQAAVNLLRLRDQHYTEGCMYILLDAVTDANQHGPRFCRFGYQPDLISICSERMARCVNFMASDWVVRLRVLEQMELSSFAASPNEYARGMRGIAVLQMRAHEAMCWASVFRRDRMPGAAKEAEVAC